MDLSGVRNHNIYRLPWRERNDRVADWQMNQAIPNTVPLAISHRGSYRRIIGVKHIHAGGTLETCHNCQETRTGSDIHHGQTCEIWNALREEHGVGRRRAYSLVRCDRHAMVADLVDLNLVHG